MSAHWSPWHDSQEWHRGWNWSCSVAPMVVSMPEAIEGMAIDDDGHLIVYTAERMRKICLHEDEP